MTDPREQFDVSYYEQEVGISRYVMGWAEAIFEALPKSAQKEFLNTFFKLSPNTKDTSHLHAQMLMWQWNNPVYGFSNSALVQQDSTLALCSKELLALYGEEVEEQEIEKKLAELQSKTASAWSVIGEKKRVEMMVFARRWSWIGARRWAWVQGRMWRGAWSWLLIASRKRTVSQPTSLVSTWNNALKWHRVWEQKEKRIRVLSEAFLTIIESSPQR